jgi:glycosyltransferase involved in cell wall biosynthesis
MNGADLKVLIVAPTASMQFGGEASLPFYYFKLLNNRGAETHLLVHERTRHELEKAFADRRERLHFVSDTGPERLLTRLGRPLSPKISAQTTGMLRDLSTQFRQRAQAKRLVRELGIDVVLEPAPISPKHTSAIFAVGAPVVIGPMCGGITFPPAFRYMEGTFTGLIERVGRLASYLLNWLIPGKIFARALLVANPLAKRSLPLGIRGQVHQVVESGVDLEIWKPAENPEPRRDDTVRFVFAGRLVDWKGVQFLIEAFASVVRSAPSARLEIIGDGPLHKELTDRVDSLGLKDHIHFAGWLRRTEGADRMNQADVFVMPSLHECGGTAILEAMAMGLPVVATNWGGPGNYVNASCGRLVDPSSREGFIDGLAHAMIELAQSKGLRSQLSAGALRRVHEAYFTWDSKADRVLEILHDVIGRR